MDMAKSMMKFVMTLKSIPNLSRYTAATRFYCNIEAVSVPSIRKNEMNKRQELYSFMKQPENAINFIATIKENSHIIDRYHVLFALQSLKTYCKVNPIDSPQIQESKTFIIENLNRHLRLFLPHELIMILRTLHYFEVSSSTMIMESLLQLIRKSINDLSLEQIYILTPLLKHFSLTDLTRAIITALPKVFEAQLEIQLDLTDIEDLSAAFQYATNNKTDKRTVLYIMKGINDNIQMKELDVDIALCILFSFCKSEFIPKRYRHLLFKMQDFLLNIVDTFENSETRLVTFRNINAYCNTSCRAVDGLYNCILLNVLIDKYIIRNFEDCEGIELLKILNKFRHINVKLLNVVTNRIQKNDSFAILSADQIYTVIWAYSAANYKPPYLNELPNIVTRNVFYKSSDIKLCQLTIYLVSLGCFDPKLIARVFTTSDTSYIRELQELYQIVKTLYPEYSGPWPSKDLMHSAIQSLKAKDILLCALEKILGGPNYIKSNVRTEFGYLIDYLVVFNNKHPVSIESTTSSSDLNSVINIEDLSIPSNYERVAVLAFPPEAYGRNVSILGARYKQIIRSFKVMSYKVVHLHKDKWMKMPDNEKLPYLLDLINFRRKEMI